MLQKPRVRRTAFNTQFTYNLPSRVHDALTYPVLSPQGATIVIYGHDNGLSLAWRGGRRFKQAKKPAAKQNGSVDDSVMIIDSDDDEPEATSKVATFQDNPEFEDEADDLPYPETIQTLDLPLGSAVTHIAALPMTPCPAEDASWAGADILREKLVLAVSCSSPDTYLITLPLTPPSPESKARAELRKDFLGGRAGTGAWGESVVMLAGQMARSDGVAMTIVGGKGERMEGRSRVVVASHTREASGTLRLWDVPLERRAGVDKGQIQAFQAEFLPNPVSRISFNPTHLTQLLAVFPQQAVRVYDYALPSIQPDDLSTGPFPSQGSWLLSLYQPFARPTRLRKPILDASWVSHGRAVLVLLADGMWGVWDVDGASPTGPTILGKQGSGVRGGALTSFSTSGYVEGTGTLRGVTAQQHRPNNSGEFVPMTPHTRKDVTASLSAAATPEKLASMKGGISVVSLPVRGSVSPDESAVLWVGNFEHVSVIPGISRFWDAQVRKSAGGGVNLFSGSHPTRMIRLHDLSTGLMGERCCGVGVVVNFDKYQDGQPSDGGLPIDVIVRGETRLVFVREADEAPGTKIGGVVDLRRKFRDRSSRGHSAIIVHTQQDRSAYDLSVGRTGGIRALGNPLEDDDGYEDKTMTLPSRPRSGFAFADTLDEAADAEDNLLRDVEVEMLDIMDIDRALGDMEERRESGTKRVLFDN